MPGSLHYKSQRGKGDSVTVYCACVLKPTQGFKRATTKNLHSTWLCGPLYALPKRRNLFRITKLGRQSHAASEDETLSWLLGSPWLSLATAIHHSVIKLSSSSFAQTSRPFWSSESRFLVDPERLAELRLPNVGCIWFYVCIFSAATHK